MFLFVPHSPDHRTTLHSGEFRWNTELVALIRGLSRKRLDVLFWDASKKTETRPRFVGMSVVDRMEAVGNEILNECRSRGYRTVAWQGCTYRFSYSELWAAWVSMLQHWHTEHVCTVVFVPMEPDLWSSYHGLTWREAFPRMQRPVEPRQEHAEMVTMDTPMLTVYVSLVSLTRSTWLQPSRVEEALRPTAVVNLEHLYAISPQHWHGEQRCLGSNEAVRVHRARHGRATAYLWGHTRCVDTSSFRFAHSSHTKYSGVMSGLVRDSSVE